MKLQNLVHSKLAQALPMWLLTVGALGTVVSISQSAQAANITGGKTTAPAYVTNVPGNGGYEIIPLLTVGDEVNRLEGDFGNFTVNTQQTFAFPGIPDGLGLFETSDYNYVFVNQEIGSTSTSYLNSTSNEIIKGARVSLFQFDKNWNVLGGQNLIDTVVDNAKGATYSLNTTTGFYTDSITGAALSFSRFCSAYLAQYGFEGGPIFFAPEESGAPNNRGWAVTPNGTAQSIEGLGRYPKENVVAASQYRATNSDKTVLISTEDNGDGEVYMFVGEQTASDPNGFRTGELYVLKVDGATDETLTQGVPTTATWTKVDPAAVLDPTGALLTSYVNAQGRSTDFERPEDINEDPNNPGTFYFVTTGTTDKLTGGTASTPGEAENPYGKLYRFTLNPNDPTGALTNFELVLNGGFGTGVSYDNIVVDHNGNVLIQEDETAFGGSVMAAENRDARVWSYNIASGNILPLFEVDDTAGGTRPNPGVGVWETSGIIEVDPNAQPGRSSYLFDVQAHSIRDSRYVEGGQLILVQPVAEPTTTGALVLFGLSALGLKLKQKGKSLN